MIENVKNHIIYKMYLSESILTFITNVMSILILNYANMLQEIDCTSQFYRIMLILGNLQVWIMV